jgi:exodeoxyribonuclease VII small subunit
MSVSNTAVNPEAPANFEQAYAELEAIVAQMESGQMPLEASLAAYSRGSFLLQYCQNALAEVEQQVQILNERNQLTPFDQEND